MAVGEELVMADELVIELKLREPDRVSMDFKEPDKLTLELSQAVQA